MKFLGLFAKTGLSLSLAGLLILASFFGWFLPLTAQSTPQLSVRLVAKNITPAHDHYNTFSPYNWQEGRIAASSGDWYTYGVYYKNDGSTTINNLEFTLYLPEDKESGTGIRYASLQKGSVSSDEFGQATCSSDGTNFAICPSGPTSEVDSTIKAVRWTKASLAPGTGWQQTILTMITDNGMKVDTAVTLPATLNFKADGLSLSAANRSTVFLTTRPGLNWEPDENIFFRASADGQNFADPLSIDSGKEVIFTGYTHNGYFRTTAKNLRLTIQFPQSSSSLVTRATFSASNADSVSDTATININRAVPQTIEYVAGSFRAFGNDGIYNNTPLPISLTSDGFTVALADMPGCVQYITQFTFKARLSNIVVIGQQPGPQGPPGPPGAVGPPANITVSPTQTLTMNPTQTLTQNPQITVTTAQAAPTQLPKTGFPVLPAVGAGAGLIPVGYWLTTLKLRRKINKEDILRESLGLEYL